MTLKIASIRIEDTLLERVDQMAQLQERSRAWVINQAIAQYLDYEEWFVHTIEEGIAQADAGQLVSHETVKQKWKEKIANQMDADSQK